MNRYFCWHKWTPWGKLTPTYNNVRQYRSCTKCNKVIHRRAGCSNDFNLALWNEAAKQEH